jgi:hypothetical protein
LFTEPHGTATNISSGTLTGPTTEFGQSITPPGEPGSFALGEGVYVFHIRTRRLSGTKNVKVKGRIYTRTSGGTETLIAESNETPNLTGSFVNYTLVARGSATILAPTDRIVVKYAATPYDSGTNPTTDISFNSSSGYTRVELPSNLQEHPILRTGDWLARPETWTRTGNHTFTMSGDWTSIYRKGVRVRYRDGGSDEYGAIYSSSHSAGTTTITLLTNTNYAMAAATITHKYISYAEKPDGFPDHFNWTPSTMFATVGNGTLICRFYPRLDGFMEHDIYFELGSTSSITGANYSPPAAHDVGSPTGSRFPVALVTFSDASPATSYTGVALSVPLSSVFGLRAFSIPTTYATQITISSTIPFTWTTGDFISIEGVPYPY